MIEQKWIAADGTPIPEQKFYDGLPVWSFTENLKNKKVVLKPSILEPRAVDGTVHAFRLFLFGLECVDVYDDQELVVLHPDGFSYKPAGELNHFDAIVYLNDGLYQKRQNLFLNAEVATITAVEPLGPRQVCQYRPVAKTFVAEGFLGRFNG